MRDKFNHYCASQGFRLWLVVRITCPWHPGGMKQFLATLAHVFDWNCASVRWKEDVFSFSHVPRPHSPCYGLFLCLALLRKASFFWPPAMVYIFSNHYTYYESLVLDSKTYYEWEHPFCKIRCLCFKFSFPFHAAQARFFGNITLSGVTPTPPYTCKYSWQ